MVCCHRDVKAEMVMVQKKADIFILGTYGNFGVGIRIFCYN